MLRQDQIQADALTWLLEPESPGARYLTLRDILRLPTDDPELVVACQEAHRAGPIADILAMMAPEGYWEKPGPGYGPKYRSTVWAVSLLAQLGARVSEDDRINCACQYLLDNSLQPGGQFTATSGPSGAIDCLQGNLCWALAELGCEDQRLGQAYEWMARTVTGEGMAPIGDKSAVRRYYAYKCGPDFACGANNKKPCAWGAVKVMMALGNIPDVCRSALVERAIQRGIDFLLASDPGQANFPTAYDEKTSGNWWKFGFPVFYVTDLLQLAEALTSLGYGHDPRLSSLITLIREKSDRYGRWMQEYPYGSKTWSDFGTKGQPNKWVTLRALRLLSAVQ